MSHSRTVTTRRVFYLPGYDPMPPRRYRELYRTESRAQADLRGYDIAIRAAAGRHFGWDFDAHIEGVQTQGSVEVLVWSDIVQASMARGILATYGALVRTAWIYIASGALRRLMWLRKGPVIAALYPVAMLVGQLIVAISVGALVAALLRGPVMAMAGSVLLLIGLQGLVGVASAWAVLRYFRRIDNRLYAHYLMQDYAYSAHLEGANPPELEMRMAGFADTIAETLETDVDEVLIVGHSSGAHLAVSILADLIRGERVPDGGPALSFLSLGQVIPMVSFLPAAHRLRADLHLLSQSDRLAWVDVTAPGDGCAFALCDPVAVSGVAPQEGKLWPLILSAAFTKTLRAETFRALRWRFFRLHFQYLCAFDNLPDASSAYDYFAVTAGPLTLADRFAGRMPSRSRIEVAASRHTSMAA